MHSRQKKHRHITEGVSTRLRHTPLRKNTQHQRKLHTNTHKISKNINTNTQHNIPKKPFFHTSQFSFPTISHHISQRFTSSKPPSFKKQDHITKLESLLSQHGDEFRNSDSSFSAPLSSSTSQITSDTHGTSFNKKTKKTLHTPQTSAVDEDPTVILPTPSFDSFLGSSGPSLQHAFNPDLSRVQKMHMQSAQRSRKVNSIDLTQAPTSVTGRQLTNKNWGIKNVINFLKTQKISELVIFDTVSQSAVCDYTIICNVLSSKPMHSLVEKLVALGRMNKGHDYHRYTAGTDPDGLWAVAELGHIVIHVLTPAGRTSPMFQRVERKLLNNATLLPVSTWDHLVDAWQRQDQALWEAHKNQEIFDWSELQRKNPKLQGVPPPPGYYVRPNTPAINPSHYDDLSDPEAQDAFNYLDLNEDHQNRMQTLEDMGYHDNDQQIDVSSLETRRQAATHIDIVQVETPDVTSSSTTTKTHQSEKSASHPSASSNIFSSSHSPSHPIHTLSSHRSSPYTSNTRHFSSYYHPRHRTERVYSENSETSLFSQTNANSTAGLSLASGYGYTHHNTSRTTTSRHQTSSHMHHFEEMQFDDSLYHHQEPMHYTHSSTASSSSTVSSYPNMHFQSPTLSHSQQGVPHQELLATDMDDDLNAHSSLVSANFMILGADCPNSNFQSKKSRITSTNNNNNNTTTTTANSSSAASSNTNYLNVNNLHQFTNTQNSKQYLQYNNFSRHQHPSSSQHHMSHHHYQQQHQQHQSHGNVNQSHDETSYYSSSPLEMTLSNSSQWTTHNNPLIAEHNAFDVTDENSGQNLYISHDHFGFLPLSPQQQLQYQQQQQQQQQETIAKKSPVKSTNSTAGKHLLNFFANKDQNENNVNVLSTSMHQRQQQQQRHQLYKPFIDEYPIIDDDDDDDDDDDILAHSNQNDLDDNVDDDDDDDDDDDSLNYSGAMKHKDNESKHLAYLLYKQQQGKCVDELDADDDIESFQYSKLLSK